MSPDRKNSPLSPTLDKIDNTKGYIEGNVALVCHRCNTIKSDATIEELQIVIDYIRRIL